MTYEKKNPGSLLSEFSNLIKQNKEAAKEKQQNRKKDFFKKYNLEEGSINLFDELAKLKKETNEAKNSEPEDLKPLEQKVEDLAIIVEQIAPELQPAPEEVVKPVESLIEKSVNTITKISETTSLFVTPEVNKTPPNFKEIQRKLEYLEKWIYRISAEGPGSGSYWLNDLGDTDHNSVVNAANNQVLTYYSDIDKWIAADAQGGITQFGSFYDTTTQSVVEGTENTAYAMKLNSVDSNNRVYITSNTQIHVMDSRAFNIQFSAQLHNTGGGGNGVTVHIWLRKNGTNVPMSATDITVPTNNPYVVAAWNFVVSATAGDFYELMWATDNHHIVIQSKSSNGVVPGVPSVIVTVT